MASEEPEGRQTDQEPDEEERFDEGEAEGNEEDDQEDVEHSRLGVLGADFHDALGIFGGSLLAAVELDVFVDEGDRAVGAGGDGLAGWRRRTSR